MRRRDPASLLLPAFVCLFFVFFMAGASSGGATGQEAGDSISSSEKLLDEQSEELLSRIDDISESQGELEEAQAVVDLGERRVRELSQRRDDLSKRLGLAAERRKAAKVRYEETVQAAYRGSGIQGVELFLNTILGGADAGIDPALTRAVLADAQTLEEYREAETYLKESQRQVEETDAAYDEAIGEKEQNAKELQSRIQRMQASAAEMRSEIQTTRNDIARLEKAERRRIERERAATVSSPESSPDSSSEVPDSAVDDYAAFAQYESEVSEGEIYVEEVEAISDERYIQLYQEAAEQYGFADDWYILAAIGKIESGHGANMGPSTAGAMGPMQFLPSTWVASGVDGNGDGVANIMDPEDAIPAAAGYLKAGGAPDDWYAAIFSYNHADWYVQEVLAVSEGYRQLAEQEGQPTL